MKIHNKSISRTIIFVIYILSIYIGYIVLIAVPYKNDIVKILIADATATVIVFLFSFIFRNSSVYDPYWSVIPPFIAAWLIFINPDGNSVRQYLIFGLVLFWAMRLTANWARGWNGLSHEDWRYQKIAADTGKMYWPVSFLGIHLMPTLFVFMGCLPLWFSLKSSETINLIDLIAAIVTLAAILIEWISDEQLRNFKKNSHNSDFIRKGLWSRMRHPNYFGEILFWMGLFLFIPGTKSKEGLWTAIGFIFMIVLFKFISIPLMDKRNLTKRPGYEKYINEVYALMPIKKLKK
jgi:steroid 5-alpha reductase family enzyme